MCTALLSCFFTLPLDYRIAYCMNLQTFCLYKFEKKGLGLASFCAISYDHILYTYGWLNELHHGIYQGRHAVVIPTDTLGSCVMWHGLKSTRGCHSHWYSRQPCHVTWTEIYKRLSSPYSNPECGDKRQWEILHFYHLFWHKVILLLWTKTPQR